MIIKRNENGKLQFNELSMNIMFDDLFENCKTPRELNFVAKHIVSALESACCDMREVVEGAGDFDLCDVVCEYYNI